MYKQASKIKLRVLTDKGLLSVEHLWDLTLADLDQLAIQLQKLYKDSGKKSFLAVKTKKDQIAKLTFDIVLDILNTKVVIAEASRKSADTKAHNQKILGKIADAKDKAYDGMSVEELEAQLK